jgi:hypothetical protein
MMPGGPAAAGAASQLALRLGAVAAVSRPSEAHARCVGCRPRGEQPRCNTTDTEAWRLMRPRRTPRRRSSAPARVAPHAPAVRLADSTLRASSSSGALVAAASALADAPAVSLAHTLVTAAAAAAGAPRAASQRRCCRRNGAAWPRCLFLLPCPKPRFLVAPFCCARRARAPRGRREGAGCQGCGGARSCLRAARARAWTRTLRRAAAPAARSWRARWRRLTSPRTTTGAGWSRRARRARAQPTARSANACGFCARSRSARRSWAAECAGRHRGGHASPPASALPAAGGCRARI